MNNRNSVTKKEGEISSYLQKCSGFAPEHWEPAHFQRYSTHWFRLNSSCWWMMVLCALFIRFTGVQGETNLPLLWADAQMEPKRVSLALKYAYILFWRALHEPAGRLADAFDIWCSKYSQTWGLSNKAKPTKSYDNARLELFIIQ